MSIVHSCPHSQSVSNERGGYVGRERRSCEESFGTILEDLPIAIQCLEPSSFFFLLSSSSFFFLPNTQLTSHCNLDFASVSKCDSQKVALSEAPSIALILGQTHLIAPIRF